MRVEGVSLKSTVGVTIDSFGFLRDQLLLFRVQKPLRVDEAIIADISPAVPENSQKYGGFVEQQPQLNGVFGKKLFSTMDRDSVNPEMGPGDSFQGSWS